MPLFESKRLIVGVVAVGVVALAGYSSKVFQSKRDRDPLALDFSKRETQHGFSDLLESDLKTTELISLGFSTRNESVSAEHVVTREEPATVGDVDPSSVVEHGSCGAIVDDSISEWHSCARDEPPKIVSRPRDNICDDDRGCIGSDLVASRVVTDGRSCIDECVSDAASSVERVVEKPGRFAIADDESLFNRTRNVVPSVVKKSMAPLK